LHKKRIRELVDQTTLFFFFLDDFISHDNIIKVFGSTSYDFCFPQIIDVKKIDCLTAFRNKWSGSFSTSMAVETLLYFLPV
jgi:hypothetical protein